MMVSERGNRARFPTGAALAWDIDVAPAAYAAAVYAVTAFCAAAACSGTHLNTSPRDPASTTTSKRAPAGEDLTREPGLLFLLYQAFERTRPVLRIVAALGEIVGRLFGELEFDLALLESLAQAADLDADDLAQLLAAQRMEHHDLVDAVEKLGTEALAQHVAHPVVLLAW
jgi:hypothetical protein